MQGIPQGPNQQNSSGAGSQKPSLSWSGPGSSNKPSSEKPKAPAPKSNNDKGGQDKSNLTTYTGIFVAGLIVGGLLGWAALGGRGPATPATTGTTGTSTATTTGTSSGTTSAGGLQDLAIASGQEPGATVVVSNINVTQPTWVVIYDDQAGTPGRALGAQLFFPASQGGETSGNVSLVRSTQAGHTYLAGERIDDGDHIYVPANDHPILDANAQQLTLLFTTK